jgi:hypothetical protein
MPNQTIQITRRKIFTISVLGLLVSCLVAFAVPQKLTDKNSIQSLTSRAFQEFLKQSYKGNGKEISASTVNEYLAKNKISSSMLPPDIGGAIGKGTVQAMFVPDVSNPIRPGLTGDVVIVRSTCQLGTTGCSHRGFLIQPPSFLDCDDCYEHCSGCEGAKNPPQCDLYDVCVCTMGRSPAVHCKKCTGC